MDPVPGTRFGRYLLDERIAFGGMAEIFRARYQAAHDFEKVVVIKRILPQFSLDPEFVSLFRDEAVLTVRLSHANVVQVFDFGKEGTDWFLVMEYVNGWNLRQVIKRFVTRGEPVPMQLALYVALEAAKGLAYAHTRTNDAGVNLGIIHRDVTPSNILVSSEGEVKVADFGIAKAASRVTRTQVGKVRGKTSYFAPEQLAGDAPLDARIDQFALGNVLWEMLTGRRLVEGGDETQILDRITEGPEFPPPSSVNAEIPDEVDRVVSRALRRNPAERYPDVEEMARDLHTLVARLEVSQAWVRDALKRLFDDAALPLPPTRSVSLSPASDLTGPTAAGTPPVAEPAGTRKLDAGTPRDPAPAQGIARRTAKKRRPLLPVAIGSLALLGALAVVNARYDAASTSTPTHTPTADPTPITKTAVPPSPTPTPRVVIARTPASTPTATAAAAGSGKLSVDSRPWGAIYIDGRATGRQTPAFDMVLPAGVHEIRIANPDQQLEARFSVTVKAGESIRKGTITLAPRNP